MCGFDVLDKIDMIAEVTVPWGWQLDRMLSVLGGISCIFFGYRLFYVATERQGELRVKGQDVHLNLRDVGPGVFFALFGAVVLTINLWHRPSLSDSTSPTSGTQSPGLRNTTIGGLTDSDVDFVAPNFEADMARSFSSTNLFKMQELRMLRNVLRRGIADKTAYSFWRADVL